MLRRLFSGSMSLMLPKSGKPGGCGIGVPMLRVDPLIIGVLCMLCLYILALG